MDVRIKYGTPLHGRSLCETCSRAHIARGFGEGEVLVICQATSPEHRVPYRVRECSNFLEIRRESLNDMKQIAWVLTPREEKRKAGFVSVREQETETEIELILGDSE